MSGIISKHDAGRSRQQQCRRRTVSAVSRRGVERIRAGHPWIYRSDVVTAVGRAGRRRPRRRRTRASAGVGVLGAAPLRSRSRVLSVDAELDERDAAGATGSRRPSTYRRTLGIDDTACRLVHGEADRLPGLVVDRYGDAAGACRRSRRAPTAGLPAHRRCWPRSCSRAAFSRATIRKSGGSRGWRRGRGRLRRRPGRRRGTRGRDPPCRSTSVTARRPGCSWISARITRRRPAMHAAGRSTHSRITADSRCRWQTRCDSVLAIDSSAAAVAATRANATPQRPREHRGP